MTLATLRAHIWKGGSDIMLYYKANGRKEIPDNSISSKTGSETVAPEPEPEAPSEETLAESPEPAAGVAGAPPTASTTAA